MHLLFIKWNKALAIQHWVPMNTSQGKLLWVVDEWCLLVLARWSKDPNLSEWVIPALRGKLSPMATDTQLIHCCSHSADCHDGPYWQRKPDTEEVNKSATRISSVDRRLQSTSTALWTLLIHREICVPGGRRDIENIWWWKNMETNDCTLLTVPGNVM